jgi:hypothetical protein
MRVRMISVVVMGVVLAGAVPAWAEAPVTMPCLPIHFGETAPAPAKPLNLRVSFTPDELSTLPVKADQTPVGPPPFEYSDGYRTRAKIHKLASWAMLPLFGFEAYLGQKMFNDVAQATDGNRRLHKTVAWGIGGLFALNTVTGVPNLIESRQDPNKSDLSLIHGVLMLVADAGFLTTALTRPNSQTPDGLDIYTPKKNQHLTIAYASISVATVSYLLMLFGK